MIGLNTMYAHMNWGIDGVLLIWTPSVDYTVNTVTLVTGPSQNYILSFGVGNKI